MYPCPAPTAAGRSAPARSHRRRGRRRGGAGLARPTGCVESVGGGGARWAGAEHGWRRGGAAAVSGYQRSWRRTGEHGEPKRARAPGRDEDTILVLNLAEEVVEVGCRR
jgi:hypothetical protein